MSTYGDMPPANKTPEQEHEEFVNECCSLIPESYDGDEAPEAIVLRFLKDMSDLGGILARLTSSYR